MKLLTIDFETFYSKDVGFSKLTTEEYVRHPDFHVIGVSVKNGSEEAQWASGTDRELYKWLQQFDWENSVVLAHNATFDGSILSWRYDIRPKFWMDTLCMGRAIHGVEVGGSLGALTERYELGVKGDATKWAIGLRREDFTEQQLSDYGDYCINDVELTYKLFNKMLPGFPKKELHLINLTTRMFTEPVLRLDVPLLQQHLADVQEVKTKLLANLKITEDGVERVVEVDELMSNNKFAAALRSLGVEPPMKISLTTGKEALALAKSDEEFKALATHPKLEVQALVAARLGVKSTLEETRTERFLEIASRGELPIPLKYYAAHTGRWGGDDKINLQNLPSRGDNAGKLKMAIKAPVGHTMIDADSSQIEARVLAWLAGQDNIVKAFANGEDVYRIMASTIYGKAFDQITKEERFVGKTTILGCIGAGTQVLCDSGWKAIESVTLTDKLWDGEEWVCHQGLLMKGLKQTLNLCGVWLTPDHKVLSGTQWLEAQLVAQDESTLCRALGTGAENLPLQGTSRGKGMACGLSSFSATAGYPSTRSSNKILKILRALAVIFAPRKHRTVNDSGSILTPCMTMLIGLDYLIGYPLRLLGATTPTLRTIPTTEAGEFKSIRSGERIEPRFLSTCKRLMGGMLRSLRWTELTTTRGTNRATLDSCLGVTTCVTSEQSLRLRKNLQTYDIAYSGPRNRFTILTERGPIIVHNCGYGMGAAKFQAALKNSKPPMDITLDEARRVIDIYRKTNPYITALWRQAQQVIVSLSRGESAPLGKHKVLKVNTKEQGIVLPSGLLLRYDDLQSEQGEQGLEFTYKTRRGRIRVYGGKVIENVCQAIARCVIGEQMLKIAQKYRVVLTVHDAVGCIVPDKEVEEARAFVETCMRWTPDWATGLPVNCESGAGKSYGEC